MKTKKHAVTLVLAVACVAVFTLMMGGTAMAAPTDPTGLTATAISSSQIDLAWTASTDTVGVYGYEVHKSTDNVTFTWAGTNYTNSYSATGLTASTLYYFKVRAYDAAFSYSGFSNIASATTQAGTTPPPTTGAYSQVTGTVHNLATTGTGVCANCHKAHNATGDLLWARPVGTTFTGIKALCYSCHDGSAANEQYAFDAAYSQHPYDCNLCHDPHNNSYGSFLQFATGANVCNNCHAGELGMGHPTNIVATMVPADVVFNPTADMSGTRLYNSAGTSTTGGTYIKCLTCHTAHGGVAGTRLNTMNYSATSAALCTNCHP